MRNKVQLIGNLAAAPEVKEISGHGKVANVSIATHDYYKNAQGETTEETTWHDLVLWNKLAETAEKLFKKGSFIALEGKIVNRSFEAKDGTKRFVSEILVSDFVILDKKTESKEDEKKDANPKKK